MLTGPHLRPSLVDARERLVLGRQKIRQQHDSGSPGIQVCAHLTDLMDTVVLDIFESALDAEGRLRGEVSLVPHGGYGRRDVAPYSDADLMLLHSPAAAGRVAPLARRLSTDLYDVGLVPGFSIRTPADACQFARQDAIIFTSLVEARYLSGSVGLFTKFARRFRRQAHRRVRSLMAAIHQARQQEQAQYGETVYLLAPNVKRSQGGLRDLQLVRWIGFARHGEAEPQSLQRLGALSREDAKKLRAATEFLLRLRNEMHFHAGQTNDVLDRAEQVRLAELYGYPGQEGLLPVEQFMQQYFHHTIEARDVVAHFVASARPRSSIVALVSPLLSHQVEGDFRVGPVHIRATRRGLAKVVGDLAQVLRLMDLANLYDKRIDHETWQAIRQTMTTGRPVEVSSEAIQRFLVLISRPGKLSGLLRRLHELRVLEKIIPGMSAARCLLQFNEYHKYTVDAHCLRAVECATEFLSHTGPLGDAYRGIRQKRTLHLALLIHDLGKGHAEDHSDVGLRLAKETAQRLQLPQREAEALQFLVHKHLLMSHLAQRRDTSDPAVIVQFAVEVGSPDVLQMLYVLTCADLAAVGPGVLNQWKLELLTDLYLRGMAQLTAGTAGLGPDKRLQQRRQEIRALLGDEERAEWFGRQIDAIPSVYLLDTSVRRIADQLRSLSRLQPAAALAWGRYLKDRRAVQFTVGTFEQAAAGIFHRLTGALTSQGLQILAAEIHTLADGLVLDRFYVLDDDYSGRPPAERLESVSRGLIDAVCDTSGSPPVFRQLWKNRPSRPQPRQPQMPTRVQVDNNTSNRFTIVEVFAHDRMGLLYAITRTLFELGASVFVAKIGTYLDQVVDVFYVTDEAGRKIEHEQRLREMRERLLAAIEKVSGEE